MKGHIPLLALLGTVGFCLAAAIAVEPAETISKPLLADVDRALWACSELDNSGGWPPRSAVPLPSVGIREACVSLRAALLGSPEMVDAFQAAQLALIRTTAMRLKALKGD